MSLRSLLTQDITILRAGSETDRYSNAAKDWGTAASTVTKGWLAQRSADEDNTNREAEVETWVLFLSPEETITGRDRVRWSGITFEVVGPPKPAYSPRGLHHYEVALRAVEG